MIEAKQKSAALSAALLLGAAACAAICLYAISRRSPGAVTPAQLATYYIAPAVMALALAAASLMPAGAKANLVLLLVSTGLALLGAELVLAMMPPPNVPQSVAPDADAIDARTALEVARDLTREGTPAYPHLPASVSRTLRLNVNGQEMLSLSGALANTLTVFCNDTGKWLVYRADAHGFNNDQGAWTKDRTEAVLIGDSYAHGWCVPRSDNVAAALSGAFPTAINLGVSAAGPLTELAIMREFVVGLAPRNVIWMYYEGNDLADLTEESDDPLLTKYLDEGFTLGVAAQQQAVDERLRMRLEEILEPPAAAGDDDAGLQRLGRHEDSVRPPWRLHRLGRVQTMLMGSEVRFPSRRSRLGVLPLVLAKAQAMTKKWGGRFYFVYLPDYSRYQSRVGEVGTERSEVLRVVADLGIPLIDMVPVFAALDDPRAMWLHPAGHYNRQGYGTVGREIVKSIDH